MIGKPLPLVRRLLGDTGGVAMVEFAYSLPLLLVVTLSGAELTSYITTKMRISQVALHVADNAARIGSGSLLSAKTISESQINDTLTGAGLQAGDLNLYANGRIIISSVQNDTTANRYRIAWQRCRGSKVHPSSYGTPANRNVVGVGPTGRQVVAPADGAVMFVEVAYDYQPLFTSTIVPSSRIVEIAAMTVRDRRDLTQIYNTENATVSNCA